MTTDDYVRKVWTELYPRAGELHPVLALALLRAEVMELRKIEQRLCVPADWKPKKGQR